MPSVLVERDTVDEVVRTGRALLTFCYTAGPRGQSDPASRRAAIDFETLLNELANCAGERADRG